MDVGKVNPGEPSSQPSKYQSVKKWVKNLKGNREHQKILSNLDKCIKSVYDAIFTYKILNQISAEQVLTEKFGERIKEELVDVIGANDKEAPQTQKEKNKLLKKGLILFKTLNRPKRLLHAQRAQEVCIHEAISNASECLKGYKALIMTGRAVDTKELDIIQKKIRDLSQIMKLEIKDEDLDLLEKQDTDDSHDDYKDAISNISADDEIEEVEEDVKKKPLADLFGPLRTKLETDPELLAILERLSSSIDLEKDVESIVNNIANNRTEITLKHPLTFDGSYGKLGFTIHVDKRLDISVEKDAVTFQTPIQMKTILGTVKLNELRFDFTDGIKIHYQAGLFFGTSKGNFVKSELEAIKVKKKGEL